MSERDRNVLLNQNFSKKFSLQKYCYIKSFKSSFHVEWSSYFLFIRPVAGGAGRRYVSRGPLDADCSFRVLEKLNYSLLGSAFICFRHYNTVKLHF